MKTAKPKKALPAFMMKGKPAKPAKQMAKGGKCYAEGGSVRGYGAARSSGGCKIV